MNSTLIERFEGDSGRRLLVDALLAQAVVRGDRDLASACAEQGELMSVARDEVIIQQDAPDNDLYLMVAGTASVSINGREVALRTAGQCVGEMAVIDPSARRSASVVAIEECVLLKLKEATFSALAEGRPEIWRRIAAEIGDRLRQRSRFFAAPNPRPVLFIGSSSEALPVARAVQLALRHDEMLVRVWTDGVFGASHFPIEDLETQLQTSDFAVLVLGPDDLVTSRGRGEDAPRDNVILELGLFLGALGRGRTYVLRPQGGEIKIPTDLLGLTPLEYTDGGERDRGVAVAPACEELRRLIARHGPR